MCKYYLGDVIFDTIDKNGTGCNMQIFLSHQSLQSIQYAWYIFFKSPIKESNISRPYPIPGQ